MIFKRLSKFASCFCFLSFINLTSHIDVSASKYEPNNNDQNKEEVFKEEQNIKSEYIVGPGDTLYIQFIGLDIFNSQYSVDPEGFIFLPELEQFYVEGKTIKELNHSLTKEFKRFLINPKLNVFITKYRPVKVFIKGEVKKPGLYMFGYIANPSSSLSANQQGQDTALTAAIETKSFIAPRIFDVFKESEGITNFADLSEIFIIRKNSYSQGGGRIKAKINLLSLIRDGDQSQNIRLMDGDIIEVSKSSKVLKEQINAFNRSNLSPQKITVYVSGNVKKPGAIRIKQGSKLIQAISVVGGEEFFTGKISHVRLNDSGKAYKSSFKYNPNTIIESKNNPILMEGDIITVKKSFIGKSAEVLKEVSTPILTGYGLYNLFD